MKYKCIYILLLCTVISVSSCRSRKEVVNESLSRNLTSQVLKDTVFSQKMTSDSTLYTLVVNKVITYRQDGTKEKEEVQEVHKEQKAVKSSEVANSVTTEIGATVAENATVEKDVVVDATPVVKATNNVKSTVIGTIIIVLMAIATIIYTKYKKAV